ncbi:MAG: hypothetical protein P4L11_04060 [Geothrix sp.]|nr:hypothetical protein [Geothrix sp.]
MIFLTAVAVLALVTSLDILTPFELGFSAFYAIPVLIATWGVGLSRGLGFAILSACCWYFADLTSGRPLTHEFYRFWDLFNHLLSYTLIAVLTGRLKLAFQREQALREDLDRTLKDVQALEGLLPMCAWCKKVRDDEGDWLELEAYLRPRTKAAFSHGICPACAARLKAEEEGRA